MKKRIALSLVLAMALSLFPSCSKKAPVSASGDTKSASDFSEPVKIEYLGWSNNKLDGSDAIYKAIQKKFNMTLTYTVVPNDQYENFMSVRLASGNVPEMFKTQVPNASDMDIYRGLVEDKAIVNVSDYIKKYNFTNLSKIYDDKDVKMMKEPDGYYMIPNIVPNSTALYVREDWMKKLNLTPPKTTDEFKDFLSKIVKASPDGTKTTGLTSPGLASLENIFTLFTGTSGDWVKSNGKWVNRITLPAFKNAVKYLADLYKNGLLDPEFAMLTNANVQEKISSGKAACLFINGTTGWFNPMADALKAYKSDATLTVIDPWPAGPAGAVKYGGASFFGAIHISKDATEAQRLRILSFLDWQFSDDCLDLYYYGVEGNMYNVVNGQKVINQDVKKNVCFGRDLYPFYDIVNNACQYKYLTNDALLQNMTWTDKHAVYNQVIGLSTDTTTQLDPTFKKIFQTWITDFITGAKNVDSQWNDFIKAYNDAGYAQYQKEVTNYMANK